MPFGPKRKQRIPAEFFVLVFPSWFIPLLSRLRIAIGEFTNALRENLPHADLDHPYLGFREVLVGKYRSGDERLIGNL